MAKQNRRDWREETLARMRALILQADPEMIEERRWKKPSMGSTKGEKSARARSRRS